MAKFTVINPFSSFLNQTGSGLNGGKVYIGVAGQDPQTNPIVVYWDSAFTDPAAQPLTTVGGYIARSGSPAAAYPSANTYSIRVLDRYDRQVFYEANANAPLASVLETGNVDLGNLGPGFTGAATISRTANSADASGTTQFYSLINRVYALGSNGYDFVRAQYSGTHVNTTGGTTNVADGIHAYVWLGGAGDVDYVEVSAAHIRVDGPGVINNEARAFRAVSTTLGASASIPVVKGFSAGDLGDATKVTNVYQFDAEDTSASSVVVGYRSLVNAGTNKYQFYGAGTAQSALGGKLGVGMTTPPGYMLTVQATGADWSTDVSNSHASSPFGLRLRYTGASPNGNSNSFISCVDSTDERFAVVSSGAVRINGQQVLGNRRGAIAAPSGGATVDSQARTAISSILTALRDHGLIET